MKQGRAEPLYQALLRHQDQHQQAVCHLKLSSAEGTSCPIFLARVSFDSCSGKGLWDTTLKGFPIRLLFLPSLLIDDNEVKTEFLFGMYFGFASKTLLTSKNVTFFRIKKDPQ